MYTQRTVCSYDELLAEVAAGRPDAYYPEMIGGNTTQCYLVRDTSIKGSPIVGVAAPIGRRLKLASSLGEPTYSLQEWDIYIRVSGLPEDHTRFTLSTIESHANAWPYLLPMPLSGCTSFSELKAAIAVLGGTLQSNVYSIDTSRYTPNRHSVDVEMIVDWEDIFVRPCQTEGVIPPYLKIRCSRDNDNKVCVQTCPFIPLDSRGRVKKSVLNNLVKKAPVTIKLTGIKPGDLYMYNREEYNPVTRAFDRNIGFIRSLPCYAALFKHGIPTVLKESYLLSQDDSVVYIPTKGSMDIQPSELIIPINIKS